MKIPLTILAFGLILVGCKKHGDITAINKEFVLSVEYRNPNGTPSLQLKVDETDNAIKFPKGSTFAASNCQSNRVCLGVNGVTFSDGLGQYEVIDVLTEEFRNGKWEVDVENKLIQSKTESIDVVLVLDLSSSLGGDVKKVKSDAIALVKKIFTDLSQARVGVTIFSSYVQTLPLSTNLSAIQSFIMNGPENENSTKLYEAIDRGNSLFSGSNSTTKVMITFTDGRNNDWSDPVKYENPNYTINQVTQSGTISYMVGLAGKSADGIDKGILNQFAINGGKATEISSTAQLENVFNKIANSVTKIYTLVYDRNDALQSTVKTLKFKINAKLL